MGIYKRKYTYPHHERFSINHTPEALKWLTTAFKQITRYPELVFADREHPKSAYCLGCNGRSFLAFYVDSEPPFYCETSRAVKAGQKGSSEDGAFCIEVSSYTDASDNKRLYIEFDHQDYGDSVKLPLLETLLVEQGAIVEHI